jgi:hypothetical protein
LRPADWQQLGQQDRNLAERRRRRITGRDVGQLWRNRIMVEIQRANALHLNRILTGTDKQPSDEHRHIAEQRTEGNGMWPLLASRRPQDGQQRRCSPAAATCAGTISA